MLQQVFPFQSKLNLHHHHDNSFPQYLFDKEVSPSDVGKLKRLVLPEQHSERNFLRESQIKDKHETLVFIDVENNREWEFRYSWKSSQSRGWSKFVKEKRVEGGDIISNATGRFYITVTDPYRKNIAVSSDIIIGRPPNFFFFACMLPCPRSQYTCLRSLCRHELNHRSQTFRNVRILTVQIGVK